MLYRQHNTRRGSQIGGGWRRHIKCTGCSEQLLAVKIHSTRNNINGWDITVHAIGHFYIGRARFSWNRVLRTVKTIGPTWHLKYLHICGRVPNHDTKSLFTFCGISWIGRACPRAHVWKHLLYVCSSSFFADNRQGASSTCAEAVRWAWCMMHRSAIWTGTCLAAVTSWSALPMPSSNGNVEVPQRGIKHLCALWKMQQLMHVKCHCTFSVQLCSLLNKC